MRSDLEIRGTIHISYIYIICICVTSIFTVHATPPQRLLTEEEARFRSLEAVANGAPVEQKDPLRWWMGGEDVENPGCHAEVFGVRPVSNDFV